MRGPSLIIAGLLVAGCTAASMAPAPPPIARTADQAATWTRLVGGKVASRPVSCLPNWNMNDMSIVDPHTIAFREGTGRVNVVTLGPGCEALYNSMYTLKTQQFGNGLCSGDIAQVVDMMNGGMTMGSCVIGTITPFVRPGG